MIFVTGGTGFLGRHLVPAICRAGHTARILAREPERHTWLARYPGIEAVRGDVTDPASLTTAMQGCTSVIHAGGYFRFWGADEDFIRTNANGTRNMLDAARALGVERFLYVSTIAVIGEPDPTNIIDETYSPQPADPYQHSKLLAEQAVLQAFREHDLSAVILRPGAFYGPLGEYAFNRLFFRDPMRGIIMQIDGGHHITFPAFIIDVAKDILTAMDRARAGEIYHVCGDWISHRDAFDIICEEANLRWPRMNIPGWMGIHTSRLMELVSRFTRREPFWPINLRSYVYNNWRVSNEKARTELGIEPTDFREGARRTIDWYRAGRPRDIPEIDC